jgi:hypothetical protein
MWSLISWKGVGEASWTWCVTGRNSGGRLQTNVELHSRTEPVEVDQLAVRVLSPVTCEEDSLSYRGPSSRPCAPLTHSAEMSV